MLTSPLSPVTVLILDIHLKTAALAALTLANKHLPGRIAIAMKRHSKTHIDQQHIPTMDPLGNVLKFLRSPWRD